MRGLVILLAVLVPMAHALAAMHLHCALEHPLGRSTAHAAGERAFPPPHDGAAHDHDRPAAQHAGDRSHQRHHSGHALVTSPLHEHHHHSDDATGVGSHDGCCLAFAAGAMPATERSAGVDVRAEGFHLPVPSGAYDSPILEPPPRPQWRTRTRA